MTIWGKLSGASVGLAVGGPLGALVGGIAGHFIIDLPFGRPADPQARSLAFTIGVVALSAKMAKADGVVTPLEVEAFHEVFEVPDDEMANVRRVFDLAKGSVAGFDAYARQLADIFADAPEVKEELIDALFHIAKADRAVHPRERAFLRDVAAIFGFSEHEFATIEARHVAPGKGDPYLALGVTRQASDAEVAKAWRRLVQETHPDRLIGQGLPAEAIRIATDKLAAINAAYETIRAERMRLK
ncbi:TerB family tellurite resistance protein [Blastochloris viridis]|nr:DnaJ-like protein DjlA [Blastochloris viridis]CUU44115.1 DnaJ-like protein DjlA [Blastochloris viridis]